MRTYIFKTQLFLDRKISRDIEIRESANLYTLAKAIISAYGFRLDHCFGFFSTVSESRYFDSERKYELFTDLIEEGEDLEPTDAESVKKTNIRAVWKSVHDTMLFLFDYGDEWLFVVKLIAFGTTEPKTAYPRVVRKIGAAPGQYADM